MTESTLAQDASVAESTADSQLDLFDTRKPRPTTACTIRMRWHEFDDAAEEMGTLCLSDRMKQLAITPVILDELACVRDGWRWPSTLDTLDLLDAAHPPSHDSLIPR